MVIRNKERESGKCTAYTLWLGVYTQMHTEKGRKKKGGKIIGFMSPRGSSNICPTSNR
jgi:hypothetical protein